MKLGQKSVENLVGFLGDLKTPKLHSEISWPLLVVGFTKPRRLVSFQNLLSLYFRGNISLFKERFLFDQFPRIK